MAPRIDPARPEVPHERARVEPVDADDPRARERLGDVSLAPRVREAVREVPCREARDLDPVRLDVLVVQAVVPDVRRRHDDDLAAVGRVGQRLLVAGHPRVEDDLAERRPCRPDGAARRSARPSSRTRTARTSVTASAPRRPRSAASRAIRSAKSSRRERLRAVGERLSRAGGGPRRRPRRPRPRSTRSDIGITLSRRPVPCDGSTRIGRCESRSTAGTIERSSVLRVKSLKVRTPRSQRMTFGFPSARTYSAASRNSSSVADMPRFRRTGLPVRPTFFRSSKFCMFRAPIWRQSAYSRHEVDVLGVERPR